MGYSQGLVAGRDDIFILPGPNALASRLWHQILDAADEVGVPRDLIEVVQGSYNPGGVSASGSTHARGGTYDLRLKGISDTLAVQWVIALRKRGACAFPRIPTYGWDKGRHIHAVDRYEPDLSPSARWQISEYDAHRNALSGSSSAHDPIPHPDQHRFTEDDMSITADDIKAIAEAVWAVKAPDPVTQEPAISRGTMLSRIRITSKAASSKPAGGTYVLSEADKDDIAKRVAVELAARLKA